MKQAASVYSANIRSTTRAHCPARGLGSQSDIPENPRSSSPCNASTVGGAASLGSLRSSVPRPGPLPVASSGSNHQDRKRPGENLGTQLQRGTDSSSG